MRRGRLLVGMGAALLASCAGSPFRGDTGIKPFGFDLWDVHCPSGLRVIFERAPGSLVAGVTTVVGVGSRQDPPGREGLAHLVEHLTFRSRRTVGDENEPPMKVRLWSLGASYNADTRFDATTYNSFVPRQHLAALLAAEGARLLEPLAGVDEATFAVEREVVRNELRERHETGMLSEATDAIRRAVFPADHAYARPAIGTHASLSALSLDDARRFAAAGYQPSAMTMVVVGDMDPAQSEAFVRGALPPGLYGDPTKKHAIGKPPAVPAGLPPEPPLPKSLPVAHAAVSTPELWIAWSLPGGYGVDHHMAEMWEGFANTTFYRGRLDDADVASVDFFVFDPEVLASLFISRVRLSEGTHPDESLRQVIAALPWIGGDGLELSDWFEALKLRALRELSFESENAVPRSRLRADYAHFAGSPSAYGAVIDAIKAVKDDQAVAFARTTLGAARARAVLIQPRTDAAPPPPPIPPAQDLEEMIRNTPLPAATLRELRGIRHVQELRTATLDGGMPLMVLRRPGAPVVTATLAFHGGAASAPAGVAAAAGEALELNFEESPGAYGIGLGFSTASDHARLTARAGAGNRARVLDMMSFAVRSYDVEWPSDKFRETKLPLLRRQEDAASRRAERAFSRALYGDHPYGQQPTAEQIAAVSKSDVVSWLGRTVAPGNGLLVIVGDVDPAQAEAAARDAFGWTAAAKPVPAPPPAPARAGGTTDAGGASGAGDDGAARAGVVHRAGATQAEIHAGCLLPAADARLDAVYDVVADLAGGTLSDQLRERTGSTYGVHVGATVRRGGTALLELEATVDNARLASAVQAIRRFWRTAPDAVEDADVAASRDMLTAHRLMHYERSAALADALVRAWNAGWPASSIDDTPTHFASVRTDEVRAALRACGRNLVWTISGDQRVVRAALTAAP